jgi:chromosome segregation ATPase
MFRYRAQRKLRKRQDADFEDSVARTESTLLEYGEKLASHMLEDEERKDLEHQKAVGRGKPVKTEEEEKKAEEVRVRHQEVEDAKREALLTSKMEKGDGDEKVSGSSVGKIVSQSSEQIKAAAEAYEEEMKKLEEARASGKATEAAHARQMEALNRKIEAMKAKAQKKKKTYQTVDEKLTELKEALGKKQSYNDRVVREITKLEKLEEAVEDKEMLRTLRDLVMLNESLKTQEAAFKQSCLAQRDELMALLAKIETGDDDEDTKKLLEVEKIFEQDKAKLDKLRQLLAKKNQEIAKMTRQIDDIPTRAELLQYERRFVELYELVSEKLGETRKFYSMYNTLEESHEYMSKEVDLLNSVIDGFPKAMRSKPQKEQFLLSFKNILSGVEQSHEHVNKALNQAKEEREALTQKYNKLVEKQRNYFKAVKEFQEECFKNEKLSEGVTKLEKKATKE